MEIHFERSGGFMGMQLRASVDMAALPDEEAQALQEMLSAADFFDLSPEDDTTTQAAGADQMTYTVTVMDEGQAIHSVCVTDATAPEAMRPLLRRLTLLARRPSADDQSGVSF